MSIASSIVACLALAGCDRVFALEPPPAPDAVSDAILPHDEDGDGKSDLEDNCPLVFNDQLDTDQDGVGDACDPHDTPVDRLVSLETFELGLGDWMPDFAAGWSLEGDALVTPPISQMRGLTHGSITAATPTIDVTFDVLELGAGPNNSFGPRLDFPADSASCTFREVVPGNSATDVFLKVGAVTVSTSNHNDTVVGPTYLIRFRRDAPDAVCNYGSTNLTRAEAVTSLALTPGILVDNARVRIHAIAIYAVQ